MSYSLLERSLFFLFAFNLLIWTINSHSLDIIHYKHFKILFSLYFLQLCNFIIFYYSFVISFFRGSLFTLTFHCSTGRIKSYFALFIISIALRFKKLFIKKLFPMKTQQTPERSIKMPPLVTQAPFRLPVTVVKVFRKTWKEVIFCLFLFWFAPYIPTTRSYAYMHSFHRAAHDE